MGGSAGAVPARVRYAVERLGIEGGEDVLEIGGGPGVSTALVCELLTTGRLLALDRSATATERTRKRNEAHLRSGRLELRTGTLAELRVPGASFDLAFSVNVNVFWTGPADRELAVLRQALRPGAALYVCYDRGPGPQRSPSRVPDAVAGALRRHGFEGVAVHSAEAGLAVTGRTPR